MKLIFIATLIPWLLHFITEIKLHNHYFNNKKNSFFDLFPIYDIILYAIFIYFSIYYKEATNIVLVRTILFFSIYLYLLFNNITKREYKKVDNITNNKLIIYLLIILLIPIIYFLITNNYIISYYIMITYSILNTLLLVIGRRICYEK